MSKALVIALLLGSIDITQAKIRDLIPEKKVVEKSHERKVRKSNVNTCSHSSVNVESAHYGQSSPVVGDHNKDVTCQ
jgi:hypothetical protein